MTGVLGLKDESLAVEQTFGGRNRPLKTKNTATVKNKDEHKKFNLKKKSQPVTVEFKFLLPQNYFTSTQTNLCARTTTTRAAVRQMNGCAAECRRSEGCGSASLRRASAQDRDGP